jgi:hypothetical protein
MSVLKIVSANRLGLARHKSTNCHISGRSATLINPRVCVFALCENYLRTTHLDFFSSKKKEFFPHVGPVEDLLSKSESY